MNTIDLGRIRLVMKDDWNSSSPYENLDVVRYGGSLFMCKSPVPVVGISPTSSASWSLLVSGVKPVGAFNTAVAYHQGEVVISGGALYIANGTFTSGSAPASDTANWSLLLPAGANGVDGTNGTNGTDGAGYGGSSTNSVTIGTGSPLAFTVQAGLAYTAASRVRASSSADPTKFVEGPATYSGTTLTITPDVDGGSGSASDWVFSLVGARGATGATGATGPAGADGATGATGPAGADGTNGTNAPARVLGLDTLAAGTVTVAEASVASTSKIFLSRNTLGGTPGHLSVVRDAGVVFTINSSDSTDTSEIAWEVVA